jgi:ABC-type transport system involved in multi-copper enzyme maturation permease subunit
LLLYNRLLWFGISIALLVLTTLRFEFSVSKQTKKKKKKDVEVAVDSHIATPGGFTVHRADYSGAVAWHQFMARTRFEVRGVLKSVFFWVLVALAGALSLGSFVSLGSFFGTEIYPVTRMMIQVMSGTVTLSMLIIIVFYGAELVWRDREVRFQEILGSSPAPNWTFVLSKMVAAVLVVVIFLGVTAIFAILWQLFSGYTNLELGLYLIGYLYDYAMLGYLAVVLSIVLQILAPNKYFGMMFMVLYIIAILTLPGAGFEDPLYIFGGSSSTPYSDMNGYDGQLAFAAWYHLYWASFAVLLGVLGFLMWSRGQHEKFMVRLRTTGANFTRATGIVVAVASVSFISLLAWIFYNTHILNEYQTSDDQRAFTAEYEKKYVHLKGVPIPRVTDVAVEVDLYPEDQAFVVRGAYTLENKTDTDIADLPVGFGFTTNISDLALEGATLQSSDEDFNFYQFKFEPALKPGERRKLSYTGQRRPTGFKHSGNIPGLLNAGGGVFGNGTFVNSSTLGPYIGFNEGAILTDRNSRWREGLEPVPRYPDLDDESEWNNSYLTQDADWVNFKADVTTSADQIAIAPGYLTEELIEGDRKRFRYEMDAPMQNFYAILSARYESRVENWNGIELSVFYYPGHDWNIDRIMVSLQKSLEYFGKNHSPYQYRQMRVLEFPAYATFAQSFPNTVPWSEGIGFIADVSDPEDIDYVSYVGAHEVAHQWWGHQVSSAKVQGQTILVETLAQYSALMVMEHEYGPHMMRKFLKYELDNYLQGRGGEAIEEQPIYRVENQQYIHYRKGSVVMYATKDYLGEDAVNRALQNLIKEAAYRYDPYPTSRDLLRNLRAQATTDAQQEIITDLFEKITLWDLKVDEATVSPRDDGKFDVTLNIEAAKFYADGEGQQEETPLDMLIDIGVFSENLDDVFEGDDHVLYFDKHRIESGESTITIVVDELPSHAGIDPYNKLIDRNSDDNVESVDEIT